MNALTAWWQAGDALMPVLLGAGLALYALLVERSVALLAPSAALHARRAELASGVTGDPLARRWATAWLAASEAEALTRGFAVIRVLIIILPLLGLLGTVAGMVETFASLNQTNGSARQASGGISQALTATQYGLTLAVPALLWEWLLRRRLERLVADRERTCAALIAEATP